MPTSKQLFLSARCFSPWEHRSKPLLRNQREHSILYKLSQAARDPTQRGGTYDISNSGGNMPHIATWDDLGNRICQYHSDSGMKVEAGDSQSVPVPHDQQDGDQSVYYIVLSSLENDAIQISSVSVGNTDTSASVYGDTGHKCGLPRSAVRLITYRNLSCFRNSHYYQ
jgi:hypothetical protein